ncbi:uncharacterized protein LOC110860918 [Folsomia candida]|uniref:Uncharacterized protein n=1 Tax=Folsomia candida TaxID=158441 RepID=A0A226EZZ6_FOLCA|nr:uncharacterized protein LOC110860918 [Folsomia candida]OXA62778.1 hypothetical protein Fcan01_03497 [Folsomia candida]
MVFVTVRLFDASGSYASQEQQERLSDKGYKTRPFDRRMDEVDYRWESFWNGHGHCSKPKFNTSVKKWTIEICGLNERFAASFLSKFDPAPRYPRVPLKSADELSYYITITTDPNLARDGDTMPISVASHYINRLEGTGLKCIYVKHISSDSDHPNQSQAMIWTLTEYNRP